MVGGSLAGAGLVGSRPLGWVLGVLRPSCSPALRRSPCVSPSGRPCFCYPCPCWAGVAGAAGAGLSSPAGCCASAVVGWACLPGRCWAADQAGEVYGNMHNFKAAYLSIFRPQKYLNDEQNH